MQRIRMKEKMYCYNCCRYCWHIIVEVGDYEECECDKCGNKRLVKVR